MSESYDGPAIADALARARHRIERDTALLRQCLVALEHSTGLTLADCVRIRNAAIALRERLNSTQGEN